MDIATLAASIAAAERRGRCFFIWCSPVAAPPKRNDQSTPASLQSDSSEPNLRQDCGQISRPQNRPSLARNGQGRPELSLGSSEKLRIMPRRMSERSNDVTVYMVLNGYRTRLVYVETAADEADRETVIRSFLSRQYSNALRVIAFNTAEGWSQDVSEGIVNELLERARRRHPLRGHEAVLYLKTKNFHWHVSRPEFPRLPFDAGRTGRPDFRHHRRDRRARAQDRGHDAAFDRTDQPPAAHPRQRRRVCHADVADIPNRSRLLQRIPAPLRNTSAFGQLARASGGVLNGVPPRRPAGTGSRRPVRPDVRGSDDVGPLVQFARTGAGRTGANPLTASRDANAIGIETVLLRSYH
jgi:hypothetical protein